MASTLLSALCLSSLFVKELRVFLSRNYSRATTTEHTSHSGQEDREHLLKSKWLIMSSKSIIYWSKVNTINCMIHSLGRGRVLNVSIHLEIYYFLVADHLPIDLCELLWLKQEEIRIFWSTFLWFFCFPARMLKLGPLLSTSQLIIEHKPGLPLLYTCLISFSLLCWKRFLNSPALSSLLFPLYSSIREILSSRRLYFTSQLLYLCLNRSPSQRTWV